MKVTGDLIMIGHQENFESVENSLATGGYLLDIHGNGCVAYMKGKKLQKEKERTEAGSSDS